MKSAVITLMEIIDSTGNKSLIGSPTIQGRKFETLLKVNKSDEEVRKGKAGELHLARIPLKDLEVITLRDPVLNRSCQVYTQKITGYGYEILPGEGPQAQENFQIIKDFINGLQTNFMFLIERGTYNQGEFGRSFLENIYNAKKDKLVDLDDMDPKITDYMRDSQQKVLFDDNNLVMGYYQLDPKTGQKIFFPRQDVVEFKWLDLGEGIPGVGLVEPIYDVSLIKLNLTDSYGESMYRLANPIIAAKVGRAPSSEDPRGVEASPDLIEQTEEWLKGVKARSTLAHPEYVEVYLLESKNRAGIQIDAFVDQQITGTGIPKPLLTGTGTETNKSTLSEQHLSFQSLIRNKQAHQQYMIEQLFAHKLMVDKKILVWVPSTEGVLQGAWVLKKDKSSVGAIPKFRFKTTSKDELAGKIERLKMMVEAGLLIPTPADEDILRTLEELPVRTKASPTQKPKTVPKKQEVSTDDEDGMEGGQ